LSRVPAVEVLLATYNGARFLREQLDSVFAQDYENVRVLARDDGSSDQTNEILAQYARRFPERMRIMPTGFMTGSAKKNFGFLMQASTADYICFCDQDDVWLPDKLSAAKHAMDQLESRWSTNTPLLVFSDLRVVDDQLQTLHPSFWSHMGIDPGQVGRLATVLVQSLVTGCTAMVNRKLIELACHMPEEAFMHDRWIALLIACFGRAGFVRSPTVLYRQHGENVLGTGRKVAANSAENPARPLLERILRPHVSTGLLAYWEMSQREAKALLAVHGPELPPQKANILLAFLRCQTSKSGWLRVVTFLRYRFFYPDMRTNLAIAAYLWRRNVLNASQG
jgi:glycosyltransferase involved in cell wall biosynthesis